MDISENNCFLCKEVLIKNTDEHIFPKWLQHKFSLWNQSITLLNGTTIPYRMLKIPCCNRCNSTHLAQLENEISKAVEGGYDSFIQLEKDKIFYWASKIMYGLLYKELSLDIDRMDKMAGTIMTPASMKRFENLHILLQGIRIQTEYEPVKPYSIFIYKMYEYEESDTYESNFDYFDSFSQSVFGMKMNDIGFVLCIEDSGVQNELANDHFDKYKDKTLHPIQLKEIYAKLNYKQSLAIYTTRYLCIESDNERVIQVIQPPGDIDLYIDWSLESYAHGLSYMWRMYPSARFEDIFIPPDKVMSFLDNEDGSFKQLPKHLLKEK